MSIKTIIVGDEANILLETKRSLEGLADMEVVGEFISSLEALKFSHRNKIELAILDVEIAGISGMDMAELLRKIQPEIKILFSNGYSRYAMKAFHLQEIADFEKSACRCESFLSGQDFDKKELQIKELQIYIRTFGNFNIYINGKALFFAYGKAKELFAFLVNERGGTVTMEQIITALWEDRPYDNRVKQLYRKAVSLMRTTFRNAGIENICFYYRGCLASNPKIYTCDYEEFLQGSSDRRKAYIGNYMAEYSWAEDTNAVLSNVVGC